ncbi:MAG: fasciclin domain-containing protein [Balneolaceae bacterium]|nr:MAG: fasciclin domain-containing protein [Balneolaceae bacterium]
MSYSENHNVTKKLALVVALMLLMSPAVKAQMETGMDIVESASQFAQIQYFHTLIVETGLEEKLREDGPFTIFAPTNQAFNELPEGVMEGLLENPDELRDVLRAHISSGTMLSEDLGTVDNMPTFEGTVFKVEHHEQGISVGGAMLVAADVVATNGAIHAIDKVLLPEN